MADEATPAEIPAETPATPSPEPQTPAAEQEAKQPPADTVAEPVAETPAEPAPELTPEPVPEPAPKPRPQWDAERQKRDEERARRERERDEEIERLKRTVDELRTKTPPAPPPPSDDELLAMADKIADLKDPTNDAFNEAEAAKLEATLRKEQIKQQSAIAREQKERREREAAEAREKNYWTKWQSDNPEHDVERAKTLAQNCYDEAFRNGAKNLAEATPAANILFKMKMDEAKKVKTPAPRQPAAPKTAPPASVSAPAGTRVIPKDTGARQQSAQLSDANAVLVAAMRGLRDGG